MGKLTKGSEETKGSAEEVLCEEGCTQSFRNHKCSKHGDKKLQGTKKSEEEVLKDLLL